MKIIKAKRILLSPLNWGIGHAARMVPIAGYFHQQGYDVFICASGAARNLMQLECNFAEFIDDVPFEITYGKSKTSNLFKLILQLPKMLIQVYKEHQLLKSLVSKYKIEIVISDNRYGFYHSTVPCFFITHQLNIKAPFGVKFINYLNHYFIKKFDACWIPDSKNDFEALAGELSRNSKLLNINYIGLLSRASQAKSVIDESAPVLYLLSGIEPQRSIFEQIILNYHIKHPHKAILIRGTDETKVVIRPKNNLIVYQVCDAKQLQNLVSACKFVICRSGYSSVMDLVKWQKNAVLVPTPGQTEQEYLSQYLAEKKWFYTINQETFLKFKEDKMKEFHCPPNQNIETDFIELITKQINTNRL